MSAAYNASHLHKQRPTPTTVANNYDYTINYYKPMIDYLNAKRRGEHPSYPHLPLNSERSLPAYSSRDATYKNATLQNDLKSYSREIIAKARQREIDFEAQHHIRCPTPATRDPRTSNQLLGTRAAQRLHLPSAEERIIRRQEERNTVRRCHQIMDRVATSNLRYNKSRRDGDDNVELSGTLKSAIRGKTATQITAALLADSENNIRVSRQRDVNMATSSSSRSVTTTNSSKGNMRVVRRTINVDLDDDGILEQLDGTLLDVKKQLCGFNQRHEDMQQSTRSRRVYFA